MTGSPVTTDRRKLLRIYLNDHLAGAALGSHLARRCLTNNRGTPLGGFLEELIDEIAEDRAVLEELMGTLGIAGDRLKLAGAVIAERLGRAKLNGNLRGYSDLSRLEELEGLHGGIDLKLRLWQSLQQAASAHPAIAAMDLDRLKDRASSQLERLEEHRLAAATRALT